ncbi:MAG: WD40 repeat domain-containing protein [Sciscionella sp.]
MVTTADAEMAAALPPNDRAVRAEVGSVACAVHAKGKTALDVAGEIARAASAALPERADDLPANLRDVLADGERRRFAVIIDALDEASDPTQARAIITDIVVPIAQHCAGLGARVLVGTRRSDDAGDLVGVFGPAQRTIDLDDPHYFTLEDLTGYAQATLQLRGAERPNNPYQPDELAAPIAARIAALANQNFLIAGLVARTHGLYDEAPITPDEVSFTADVESTLARFLDRLPPVHGVSARELLTALAFADAPGLTAELWQLAVGALFDAEVATTQLLLFARGSAANFLIESSTDTTNPTFRLFHQALSDALHTARARAVPTVHDEAALTRVLLGYGARIGWEHAPAYLFRSLPGHAVRAGKIDDLLTDTDYILHTDLRRLIPVANAHTAPGIERARLLRLTPHAITTAASQRLAMLSITEALDGTDTTFRHHPGYTPYRGIWANTTPRAERTMLTGHTDSVNSACAVQVDGRNLLASASRDATVRIWNPTTGIEEQHALRGHTNWVNSACAVQVDDRNLLASASDDATVRIWDPATGTEQRGPRGHTGSVNSVCVIYVDDRSLLASASDDATVRIWDPATGTEQHALRGHTNWVNSVCAVQVDDRNLLASAGGDRTVRIWDPATNQTTDIIAIHYEGLGLVWIDDCLIVANSAGLLALRIT